jgi:hypothetical protein
MPNTAKFKVYDNYEISPCWEIVNGSDRFIETCEEELGQFWTLYGHVNGEGVQAIGDFKSRAAAEEVYFRITGQPFPGSYRSDAILRRMRAAPALLAACQRAFHVFENDTPRKREVLELIGNAIAEATAA